jgi:ribosomal subunit interface protein
MQVQINYQGLDHTPWMEQFITKRMVRLNRYLNSSASIQVHLKFEHKSKRYLTSLSIHNLNHDYAYTSEGQNLWESFSMAVDKASRSLSEHKRIAKDRINKRFFSIKTAMA